MRIDNNYWKYIQEEKNKTCIVCTLQNYLLQPPQIEPTRGIVDERSIPLEQGQKKRPRASGSRRIYQLAKHLVSPRTPTLELDSQLTIAEYAH